MINLNYQDFRNSLTEELTALADNAGAKVSAGQVHKNNVDLDGISIHFPNAGNCSPQIYIQDLYDHYQRTSGQSVKAMAEEAFNMMRSSVVSFDLPDLTRENASSHLTLYVCGYESNKDWLKQNGIPFNLIGDRSIAVYPRVIVNENASFAVTSSVLEHLRMTKDELFQAASENMISAGMKVQSLGSLLSEMMGSGIADDRSIYVARLNAESNGASIIAVPEFLKKMQDHLGAKEFFIIPASVHEVLLLQKGIADVDSINRMIREVNQSTVDIQDQLSDFALIYNGRTLSLAKQDINETRSVDEIMAMAQAHERRMHHV